MPASRSPATSPATRARTSSARPPRCSRMPVCGCAAHPRRTASRSYGAGSAPRQRSTSPTTCCARSTGRRWSGCSDRRGQRTFGREPWEVFLRSFNDLMRARNRRGAAISVDSFFGMVDSLRHAAAGGRLDEIMGLLVQARPKADAFRARLAGDPSMIPALDPLIPAIVRAVVRWGQGGMPVSIVHDEHTTLTAERIAQLEELITSGQLAGVRLVDSRADPRVQVADFLAGVARKIASDELNDRGDATLTALLRPYVDGSSIWGDSRSWSLLRPEP